VHAQCLDGYCCVVDSVEGVEEKGCCCVVFTCNIQESRFIRYSFSILALYWSLSRLYIYQRYLRKQHVYENVPIA
jgi:hypothetical protein